MTRLRLLYVQVHQTPTPPPPPSRLAPPPSLYKIGHNVHTVWLSLFQFQFQFISHNKRTKSSKELVRTVNTR